MTRWGIIGCGQVTEIKSGPAFNQVAGFRLDMVMRRDAAKLADYALRHQVPRWTTDADALINDPDIDAVYIATPPDGHRDYALKTAAAGKICYVEKPMALNLAQCEEMAAAFEQAGLPLFVAYYRRSLPRFEKVRAWLRNGLIGTARHCHWSLARAAISGDASSWRVQPAIAGGGHFVDLASHGFDLLIHLLGEITDVAGLARNQQGAYKAEDAVTACWNFANGATGSGFWNFGSHATTDLVTIHGERGQIEFAIFEDRPIRLISDGAELSETIANPANIQLPHIENIRRHLAGDGTHPSLGRDATHASRIMDQIIESYYRV